MTVVDLPEYVTANQWRELHGYLGLGIVATGDGIRIDNLGRHWDPAKHPRGRDGRFIEVGGLVKFFDSLNGGHMAGTGVVTRVNNDQISVRIQRHDTNPSLVGTTQVFNKRQIATIPQGQVRLDRNGNVHPHDRELPDKVGKLIRRGDRVRTSDGHEGHVHLVGEDGRVAIRRESDGRTAARRVEQVERLDHPNPAQVRPHERAVHDAHMRNFEADRGEHRTPQPSEPHAGTPAPQVDERAQRYAEAHGRLRQAENDHQEASDELARLHEMERRGNRLVEPRIQRANSRAMRARQEANQARRDAKANRPPKTVDEKAADFSRSFREQVHEMDVGNYDPNDLLHGGTLNDRLERGLRSETGPNITVKIPSGSEISVPRDVAEAVHNRDITDFHDLERRYPDDHLPEPSEPHAGTPAPQDLSHAVEMWQFNGAAAERGVNFWRNWHELENNPERARTDNSDAGKLFRAVQDAPKLDSPLARGQASNDAAYGFDVGHAAPGDEFDMRATSWSISPHADEDFLGDNGVELRLENGGRALDLSPHGGHPEWAEAITPSARYRVARVEQNDGTGGLFGPHRIVYLEQVGPERDHHRVALTDSPTPGTEARTGTPPNNRVRLDAHGNEVPEGFVETPGSNGREYTQGAYHVKPVTSERFRERRKVYTIDRMTPDGRAGERIGSVNSWDEVKRSINADKQDRQRLLDAQRQDAERHAEDAKPTREQVHAALEHFGAKQETKDAVRHGTAEEAKQALANDTELQRQVQEQHRRNMGADIRQPNQREAQQHAEHVTNATNDGLRGDAAPRPETDHSYVETNNAYAARVAENLRSARVRFNDPRTQIQLGAAASALDGLTTTNDKEERRNAVSRAMTHIDHLRGLNNEQSALDHLLHHERHGTAVTADPIEARLPHTPEPDVPVVPTGIRNLPDGRRVQIPDDEHFKARRVDNMLSMLPRPQGRHRALPNNDRYLNNVRFALEDQLTAPNPEARNQLDNRIEDYFSRALAGRPEGDVTRRNIENVHLGWRAMRGLNRNDSPNLDRNQYEERLRASRSHAEVDALEREIEAQPHLSESDKHHLAGVVNDLRDNGLPGEVRHAPAAPAAPAAPPVAPPASPAPVIPTPRAPARVALMQRGVPDRGRFRGAVLHNQHGDEFKVGVMVRTHDGLEGYVTLVNPPSNRVVIRNEQGLVVQRNINRVRVRYEGPDNVPAANPPAAAPAVDGGAAAQAIVDMHAAGARQGFPLLPHVGQARTDMMSAVDAARTNDRQKFVEHVQSAIGNYDTALRGGIDHEQLRQDVERRLAAARELLNGVNDGSVHVGDPNHDPVLNLNSAHLQSLRSSIPTRLNEVDAGPSPMGRRALWQAGFAISDSLDTSRSRGERVAALDRAERKLESAASLRVPNAQAKLELLRLIRSRNEPGQDNRTPGMYRLDEPRPPDADALNANARGEDFAQEWGIERGDQIARAASERPSLQSIFDARSSPTRVKALAARAFNGQYGSGGLEFTVDTASSSGDALTVTGRVSVRPPGGGQPRWVGSFQRNISRTGVYNSSFTISHDVRAGGAATEFNYHMENWYIANGIKQVTVSAALDNGGFVWARNGFDWAGSDTLRKDYAKSKARRVLAIAQRAGETDAIAQAQDLLDRANNLNSDDPNFPTPYDISQVGWKPGMGKDDPWVGKTTLMGDSWGGIKHLDPTARAYKQQVARGKLPDPTVKTRPVQEQYDASAIPDDLRTIDTVALRNLGWRGGTLGNYEVTSSSEGINNTWFLKSKLDGRTFVIKRDHMTGGAEGVAGEVVGSDVLRRYNYYGAPYAEAHPSDDAAVIMTFVGAQHGTTNHSLVREDRRSAREIYDQMGDPSELLRARVYNAAAANADRHSGNAIWGEDDQGKLHLLLFDHAMAFNDGYNSLSYVEHMYNERYRIAYRSQLDEYIHDHGRTNTAEIEQFARELLSAIEGASFPSERAREAAISRLNAIINDPQTFLDVLIDIRGS